MSAGKNFRKFIILKYFIIPISLFFLVPSIVGFCYTEDEIVIHSYLMRGFHDGLKPKKLIPGKPNYGKVWVDKQDGSILKMEIEAESLAGYEKIRADLVHNKEILEEDYDEKNYFAASILIDF